MSDADFTELLIHTCTISRRQTSGVADALGAIPETIAQISASVPCRWEQNTETIEFTKRGKKIQARYLIFFEITANVLEDDILTWNGKKYDVLSVEDVAGEGHHLEVYASNLEN